MIVAGSSGDSDRASRTRGCRSMKSARVSTTRTPRTFVHVPHLERLVEVLLILDDDQRRAAVLEKVAHLAGSARRVDAVGDRAEGPAPPDRRACATSSPARCRAPSSG